MVGKGGVGKTTTAGALALALAREGHQTRLLSTDPAHSVGDLFGLSMTPGNPTPSPCDPRLLLEELDATGYARRWMERARVPLLELFERGTYLEERDVEPFLDLTLPGVDEVAGVLRLAELAEEDVARVVVDTAPSGHTLRLLDAGEVVASWSAAFEAMAQKAAAVAGRLTRRPVRLAGDEVVEELDRKLAHFRERVLPEGAAVLVYRAGSVVLAETERLGAALEGRGMKVALRVSIGPSQEPNPREGSPLVVIPWRTDVEGCGGPGRWGGAAGTTGPRSRPAAGSAGWDTAP